MAHQAGAEDGEQIGGQDHDIHAERTDRVVQDPRDRRPQQAGDAERYRHQRHGVAGQFLADDVRDQRLARGHHEGERHPLDRGCGQQVTPDDHVELDRHRHRGRARGDQELTDLQDALSRKPVRQRPAEQ